MKKRVRQKLAKKKFEEAMVRIARALDQTTMDFSKVRRVTLEEMRDGRIR